MAVSGKTAAPHEIPYFLGTDKPPDMAAVTKAIADKTHSRLENIHPDQLEGGAAGNIIIMEAAGNGDYHSLSGDVTMTKDGAVTIAEGAVTRAKIASASLKTARKVVFAESPEGTQSVTIEWSSEFADANYTVTVTAETTSPSSSFIVRRISEKTKKQIKVEFDKKGFGAASEVLVHAIAIHD